MSALQHRHALITGAGSGIGAAIALDLARSGARLSLAGRQISSLQTQAERLHAQVPGVELEVIALDVTVASSVEQGVQMAQTRWGPVHILEIGRAHV